jgi:hypothetical protein
MRAIVRPSGEKMVCGKQSQSSIGQQMGQLRYSSRTAALNPD